MKRILEGMEEEIAIENNIARKYTEEIHHPESPYCIYVGHLYQTQVSGEFIVICHHIRDKITKTQD